MIAATTGGLRLNASRSTVNVTASVEGLEAQHIIINGGTTEITSSDDGVNAAVLADIKYKGKDYDAIIHADRNGFFHAIDRTIALYAESDRWRTLQRSGMQADFSWSRSGQLYARLYRDLTGSS